jgi:hypothetical protein
MKRCEAFDWTGEEGTWPGSQAGVRCRKEGKIHRLTEQGTDGKVKWWDDIVVCDEHYRMATVLRPSYKWP